MDINYEHLKIFYHVAKLKSFTNAADKLHTSQPAITRTIHKLEEQLGSPLFYRTKRNVVLSPEGEILFKYVEQGLNQINIGIKTVTELLNSNCGTLSIGTNEIALEGFLFSVLDIFHNLFPNVYIRLVNLSSLDAIKWLQNGELDFAFITTSTEIKHQSLTSVNIHTFKDLPVIGSEYQYLKEKKISLKDLKAIPLVCMSTGKAIRNFLEDIFNNYNLDLIVDTETNAYAYMLPMIEHNLGYGFIPDFMVHNSIENGKVIQLDLLETYPLRNITMLYNSTYPFAGNAKEFYKLAMKHRQKK